MPDVGHKARDLLDKVVGMIEADLKHIEKEIKNGKLESDHSMDLARYSKALLDIGKDIDDQKEGARKSLSKMTDEELRQKALELLGTQSKDEE